jgi:Tol biopolymer transport system component
MIRTTTAVSMVALSAALLGVTVPAEATFPGRNGGFAYSFELGYETDDVSFEIYDWHVGVVDQNGGNRHFVAHGSEPAFSPRGRRLAVARPPRYGAAALPLRGKPITRLTSGVDRAPAWSPSGRRIAFERLRCTGVSETEFCPKARGIWTVGLDGGDPQRLMTEGADPAWSSRDEIAFVIDPRAPNLCADCQEAPSGEIRIIPARGGESRLLTSGSSPDWSPSGRQLTFTTGKPLYPGFSELHVINRDGSGKRRISSSRRGISSPTWSPDGKKIAFLMEGSWPTWNSASLVMVVNSQGGPARPLFSLPCPERLCGDGSYADVLDLAWQPLPRARP